MKTNFPSRSAFLIPPTVLGSVLWSAGVFLALAGFSESVIGNPAAPSAEKQNTLFGIRKDTDKAPSPRYGMDMALRCTVRKMLSKCWITPTPIPGNRSELERSTGEMVSGEGSLDGLALGATGLLAWRKSRSPATR